MSAASPTPMGASHFASLSRRPSSRQAYKQIPSRPPLHRSDSVPTRPMESHARAYSLNDSSDDEMPMMKFSAITNALLNDVIPSIEPSPKVKRSPTKPKEVGGYHSRSASASTTQDKASINDTDEQSPNPRRIVRLSSGNKMGSGGSGSRLRKKPSLSSAVQKHNRRSIEKDGDGEESPLDLNTPAPIPRTVRIPITANGRNRLSAGSSGSFSSKPHSATRGEEEDTGAEEYPQTVAKGQLTTSQGSVSRYGTSTVGRGRYGEEAGIQGSMRRKFVGKGTLFGGPARRGRRRLEDDEQSPLEERGDGLDAVGSSQEPESQESQAPESQEGQAPADTQETHENLESFYPTAYRDFASGSPRSSKNIIESRLGSQSPPPPMPKSSLSSGSPHPNAIPQVAFKLQVPAPRPNLPSNHDQENEAPPTFKRNKQGPLIHLDKMEKVPVWPSSIDLDSLQLHRAAIPAADRPALALRSQNTPRRPAPPVPPPPKMSILEAATSTAGAAATSHGAGKRQQRLRVNGKNFTRLDCIGRGGSSRVYRVMAENSKFFALKRVSLEDADEAAVRGFKGEIDLLKKLEGVERVIRLYDWELNEEKNSLSVLMEMGELDMNKTLELRLKSENAKFDPSFVRHYWKEMLECLQAIHEHDIVHSDLKPHNFVLVQGRLKLIDFGIANAIQTDETVNVHRETQIGTPNYMSPESLLDSNAKPDARGRIPNEPKLMKLSKPSDIWSLGCILYQMTYGRAPFAHIQNTMQRCQAIINWKYEIEYPSIGVGAVPVPPSLIKTLKRCLNRDQFGRPSATELLDDKDPFLNPVEYDGGENTLPMTEELLGRILLNAVGKCRDRAPTEAELLKVWPAGYFERLKKNFAEGRGL